MQCDKCSSLAEEVAKFVTLEKLEVEQANTLIEKLSLLGRRPAGTRNPQESCGWGLPGEVAAMG